MELPHDACEVDDLIHQATAKIRRLSFDSLFIRHLQSSRLLSSLFMHYYTAVQTFIQFPLADSKRA